MISGGVFGGESGRKSGGKRRHVGIKGKVIGSQGFVGARSGVIGAVSKFGLSFPVPLIKGIDKVLEISQAGRLANPGNLILEPIRQALVIVAGQGELVPSSAAGVAVEFESILDRFHGIIIAEGLESRHGIADWILRPEKAAELR